MSVSLSAELLELLEERVDSLDKLELLMHLRRSPNNSATVKDVSAAINLDRDEVRLAMMQLMEAGLVECTKADCTLKIADPIDQKLVDELMTAYDTDKIMIVKTIAQSSIKRLRSLAGRAFADAFIIRKKGGDDE